MGLSPYSTPSDAGILCIILVKTAMSISLMKNILRSILHVVGIRIISQEEYSYSNQPITEQVECRGSPSKTYMDEFRNRTPTVRYDSVSCSSNQECSVCLVEFKPDAEINHLACGHVFHTCCLEKWLKYWNITCPLCRNDMMARNEADENTCPIYRFAPTETVLLFPNPECLLRWRRHLKEPGWLVGAHRQFILLADDFFVGGDVVFVLFMSSSRDSSCVSIFKFASMILSSDMFSF